MRSIALALLLVASAPAFAEAPTDIKVGQTLRDANNARLGTISRVNADGSIGIILDSRFVTVAADTLSMVDGKPVTKLTRRELSTRR